ncbi:MAG: acetyl-CoA carboxylase biotin carboxyl carrier protein [Lachnospiraceae bacterium]|nr:acetyl-CoA carboxylase biotin carboxyl carrier protein [Lachnospiraceae bacterium]
MNIQDIYQLMDRFEVSSMAEFNLEMEGVKVAFKKGGLVSEVSTAAPVAPVAAPVVLQKTEEKQEVSGTVIEAPLIGTFYAAPSPEEAPFVTVGSEVKKGDVVGIIEAMKLMNEITAPCDGVIEAINVENGQMVEYHQVLMSVK